MMIHCIIGLSLILGQTDPHKPTYADCFMPGCTNSRRLVTRPSRLHHLLAFLLKRPNKNRGDGQTDNAGAGESSAGAQADGPHQLESDRTVHVLRQNSRTQTGREVLTAQSSAAGGRKSAVGGIRGGCLGSRQSADICHGPD